MTRKLILNLSLLLVVIFFASGCINRTIAIKDPTTDLSTIQSIYVTKYAPDRRGINKLIADKLEQRGFIVETGVDAPSNVDAVVTYKDKWMWDITMYMIELKIAIRNPKTNFPFASGNSYHTSLTRKSPEEMVDEVINNIFK